MIGTERRDMIDYEAARKAVFEAARPLGTEEVPLEEAFRRVLAADIVSPRNLPPFDNSAMDGYAVRSRDTTAGTVSLRLAGEAPAGTVLSEPVAPGTAVKIMTGAPVPPGADAVIPREDVLESPVEIVVSRPVVSGANIRRAAEDIRKGESALEKGAFLNSAAIGFLAALGIAKIPVSLRPAVAAITTGGEIRDVTETLDPGAIYDSNSHVLRAQIASAGARLSFAGRAGDDLGATVAVLRDALRTSQVVLTTGGVSMGDYDLVRDAFEAIGARRVFWKVAQKPGMPLAFYVLDGADGPRWLFGLPGNPGAVMIMFEEYVRPFLGFLSGRTDSLPEELEVRLSREIKKKKGRHHFLRVKLSTRGGEVWAEETGGQGSGLLRSMVPVDALALVPAGAEFLPAGTTVKAHRVEW
jgi:molybdopterin molybdotransferase